MSAIVDDEKWRKFFKVYRSLPETWEVNNDGYKNRIKRNRGWRLLLEAYREIERNASMERLKHRIGNIRTCYRRELRKIRQSRKKHGNCPDSVYVPNLWYFKELDFIRDQETAQTRRFRILEQMKMDEEADIANDLKYWQDKELKPKLKRCKLKSRKTSNISINQVFEESPAVNGRDEAGIYADSWACSYRKLTNEQKLYAKKAIEEILILGQLNALSLHCINSSSRTITKPEFAEIFDPADHSYNNDELMQC